MSHRINIDASSLSKSACERWLFNLVYHGIGGLDKPLNDIEFGSAYHIFRETLALTQNPMTACAKGQKYFAKRMSEGMIVKEKKEFLDSDFLMKVFLRYLDLFGTEKSYGKYDYLIHPVTNLPMVEQTFDIPFFCNEVVDIHLQGTIDEFVRYPSGLVCMGDDKTTSVWDKQAHLLSFRNKIQPLFYSYAVHLLSKQEGGGFFKSLCDNRLGFRINGVYLNKDIDKVDFLQSQPYFYGEDKFEYLESYLQGICISIAHHVRENTSPPPIGMFSDVCEGKYNKPCPFSAACSSPNVQYENKLRSFEARKYEPLNFRK